MLGAPMVHDGWFKAAIFLAPGHDAMANAHHVALWVKWLPFGAFLLGVLLAWVLYIKVTTLPKILAETYLGIYKFLLNAWYFDKLYDKLFVEPAKAIGRGLWLTGDATIIDGYGVNGVAATCGRLAQWFRGIQTGYVYHYAFAMIVGLLVLVTVYS